MLYSSALIEADKSRHDFAHHPARHRRRRRRDNLKSSRKAQQLYAEDAPELRTALAAINADKSVRSIVLTGAGRGFCAGQDLEDVIDPSTDKPGAVSTTLTDDYNRLIHALHDGPVPVVCAVNGIAAGAGANIALACDIVLAARSASFLQSFAKIGLVPDGGGSYFLPRMSGTARAMGLSMLADKLPAEQARDWNLNWQVTDDANLMTEARSIARHLANQPTLALGLIKREIHASARNDLARQLALEATLQQKASGSHDYQEGVAAFLEKRKPVFIGR